MEGILGGVRKIPVRFEKPRRKSGLNRGDKLAPAKANKAPTSTQHLDQYLAQPPPQVCCCGETFKFKRFAVAQISEPQVPSSQPTVVKLF